MSRIFLLDGHPALKSLSRQIVESYEQAAINAGHEVRVQHLHDMQFDVDHEIGGYTNVKPLESSLEEFLSNLAWANHIVLAAPMWWGSLPAKLKGLFDRSLLPGRAFDTRKIVCGSPKPLLPGRSARVFITSDTPRWAMSFLYHNALFQQIRRQILGFVGIKPTRITHFTGASHPTQRVVNRWLRKAARFGQKAG